MATNEYEVDGLKMMEELTINAHQVQEEVLGEILKRNAETEYLKGFLNGQSGKQLFKNNVPIVTYEDIKPYVDRIANGEPSDILLAEPVIEFNRRCKFIASVFFFFLVLLVALLPSLVDPVWPAALALAEGSQS